MISTATEIIVIDITVDNIQCFIESNFNANGKSRFLL